MKDHNKAADVGGHGLGPLPRGLERSAFPPKADMCSATRDVL